MDRKTAKQVLSRVDNAATLIQNLANKGEVNKRLASRIVHNLDSFADRFEAKVFGVASLKARQAKVIERDADEPWMDTFQNVQQPHMTNEDEPYMHAVGPSFNSKGQQTYDSDDSSIVSDRDEYNVRDLSDWSEPTKRQPSWSKGSAGNSTRQGSRKPTGRRTAKAKTWA